MHFNNAESNSLTSYSDTHYLSYSTFCHLDYKITVLTLGIWLADRFSWVPRAIYFREMNVGMREALNKPVFLRFGR